LFRVIQLNAGVVETSAVAEEAFVALSRLAMCAASQSPAPCTGAVSRLRGPVALTVPVRLGTTGTECLATYWVVGLSPSLLWLRGGTMRGRCAHEGRIGDRVFRACRPATRGVVAARAAVRGLGVALPGRPRRRLVEHCRALVWYVQPLFRSEHCRHGVGGVSLRGDLPRVAPFGAIELAATSQSSTLRRIACPARGPAGDHLDVVCPG